MFAWLLCESGLGLGLALGAEWLLPKYKRKEMTAGKAPKAILCVMHDYDSEGTYSIILDTFALA